MVRRTCVIGFIVLTALPIIGCKMLTPSLLEDCQQGRAYWSECRRYAIVERDGGFHIQRDGQAELADRFETRRDAEAKLLRCHLRSGGCPLEPAPMWTTISSSASLPPSAHGAPPSGYVPLVDAAMVKDPDKFRLDLAQCRDLASANTARDQAMTSGVGGAAAGAALGALVGLAVGAKPDHVAPFGALSGGVGGLGAGAVNQEATYQQIYKNCMIGRGWPVLR